MRTLEPKLLKGEHIIYTTGFHWVYILKAFVPFMLVIMIGSVVWQFLPMRLTSVLTMIALIASVVWVVLKVFETIIKKAYVTNKRLIYRKGWTQRDTIDVTLDRIGGIKMDQDVWQRFFGYGTVQVIVPVIEIILPRFLRNPVDFRNALYMKAAAAKAPEKPDDDDLAAEQDRVDQARDDRFGAFKELQEVSNDLEGQELGADLGSDLGADMADDPDTFDQSAFETDVDADTDADASADVVDDGGSADGGEET